MVSFEDLEQDNRRIREEMTTLRRDLNRAVKRVKVLERHIKTVPKTRCKRCPRTPVHGSGRLGSDGRATSQ